MNLIRVQSLDEALGKNALVFSGATELMRLNSEMDKNRDVVDILPFLDKTIKEDGKRVKIGSALTFSDLIESPLIPEKLKEAALAMRSPELRSQATIGGNIANKRDDSYLIPVLFAYGAKLEVMKKDKVVIEGINDYSDGIILSISIDPNVEVKTFRESLTSHSHAIVTLAKGEGICLAIKGSGIYFDSKDVKYTSDPYASAEYKKYLVSLFLKEAE